MPTSAGGEQARGRYWACRAGARWSTGTASEATVTSRPAPCSSLRRALCTRAARHRRSIASQRHHRRRPGRADDPSISSCCVSDGQRTAANTRASWPSPTFASWGGEHRRWGDGSRRVRDGRSAALGGRSGWLQYPDHDVAPLRRSRGGSIRAVADSLLITLHADEARNRVVRRPRARLTRTGMMREKKARESKL